MLSQGPSRLLRAFVLLLCFLTSYGVTAGGLAGAYERVVLYNIYRAAVATWGKEQTRILPANLKLKVNPLTGTHKNGGCNWVEFLEILHKNRPIGPQNIPSGLNLDNPDIHQAADVPYKAEQTKPFSFLRLVPTSSKPGEYVESYKEAFRIFHQARQEGNVRALAGFEKNIMGSLDEVITLRNSDTAYHMAKDLEKHFTGVTAVVDERPYPRDYLNPKGPVVRELNVQKTFDNNKGLFPDADGKKGLDRLQDWVNKYGQDAAVYSKAAENHYPVAKVNADERSTMHKICKA